MSDKQNIEEQPDDDRPPTSDDSLKSADGDSLSPDQNKILPNVEPQTNISINHQT
jgi:hypothetical protein